MSEPVVRVHIDRLVLSGLELAPAQAEGLRAALEQEISRALGQSAWSGSEGHATPRVVARPLETTPPGSRQLAAALADRIAQSIVAAE
jgi:hypothetical protein